MCLDHHMEISYRPKHLLMLMEVDNDEDVMHHDERAVELRPAGNCW